MSVEVEARIRNANIVAESEHLDQLFGADLAADLRIRIEILKRRHAGMADVVRVREPRAEPATRVARFRAARTGRPPTAAVAPPWVVLAALCLALVIALGTLGSGLWETVSPVGPGAEYGEDEVRVAIATAERYLDARNAYDVRLAKSYLSADFRAWNEDPLVDLATLDLTFQLNQAYGSRYDDVSCQVSSASPQFRVRCQFMRTTTLHTIVGRPSSPGSFIFAFNNGLIRSSEHWNGDPEWDRFIWHPFLYDFLGKEHEEIHGMAVRAHNLDPEVIAEYLNLLPHYLDLYQEWVIDNREAPVSE